MCLGGEFRGKFLPDYMNDRRFLPRWPMLSANAQRHASFESRQGLNVKQYASVITWLRIIARNIFGLKSPIKLQDSGPKLPEFGRFEILKYPSSLAYLPVEKVRQMGDSFAKFIDNSDLPLYE